MHRYIIVACISLFFIEGSSQSWPAFAESMEMQIFQTTERSQRQDLLLIKLDSAFASQEVLLYQEEVWRDMKRLSFDSLPQASQAAWLWNAAVLNYLFQDSSKANIWWSRYIEITSDSSIAALLLGYLIAMENNLDQAFVLNQKLCALDTCFLGGGASIHFKRERLNASWPFVLTSAIVPGSGLMAEGYWGSGVKAMSLNAVAAVAIVSLIRANLYVNLVTWGFVFFEKIYMGQIKQTQDKAKVRYPRRYRNQQLVYTELVSEWLKKYPLTWKNMRH
jgi:hypothetical protein